MARWRRAFYRCFVRRLDGCCLTVIPPAWKCAMRWSTAARGPATTDARGTSVGSRAIERFLRPVCLQNAPAALLPPALQGCEPFEPAAPGQRPVDPGSDFLPLIDARASP